MNKITTALDRISIQGRLEGVVTMSVDMENISGKNFNAKFKSYLRDFYVYQFKNKSIDFYDRGSFSRSRIAAAIVACTIDRKIKMDDFVKIKMADINIAENSVSITITAKSADEPSRTTKRIVVFNKPISEIFKYLHTSDRAAFFITGNTSSLSKNGKEKINREIDCFNRHCPSPITEEKIYRYWGQIYLDETNEIITTSTYRNDSIRLKTLIEKMANVEWSFGNSVDHMSEKLLYENDSCVECITADTRELTNNPFHSLYRHCNRFNNSGKDFCSIFFALILYFNLGSKIKNCFCVEPSITRMEDFNAALKKRAAKLFLGDKDDWNQLTVKQKTRYAKKVPAVFMNECFSTIIDLVCAEYKEKRPTIYKEKSKKIIDVYKKNNSKAYKNKCEEKGSNLEWEDIISWEDIKEDSLTIAKVKKDNENTNSTGFLDVFIYMINNKKRLVYNGENFVFSDLEYIEKKTLYLALVEFLDCGEKQFSNIIREFVKTGILVESRALMLFCGHSSNYENNVAAIKKILHRYSSFDIELLGSDDNNTYFIRYNSRIEEKTIEEMKQELSSICKKCTDSEKLYYSLSTCFLKITFDGNEDLISRFSEMVSFYSQTALLGEIGNYVSDRLPDSTWKMSYKHNYIVRALNDYNNIDLLYALNNPTTAEHYWIEIECRDALNKYGYQHFVCYPIKIKENVSNGKQYLVYYHPVYRSIASIRIDFIDSITVGERTEEYYFKADIERAHKLIDYTWGLQFSDFYAGNVKSESHPSKVTFTIRFETDRENNEKKIGEKFIKDRIRREIGAFEEEILDEKYSLMKITVNCVNPWDMLHWMKTYTRRIYDIEIEYNSFMDDVERARISYVLPHSERVSVALGGRDNSVLYANDVKFKQISIASKCDRLFHEIYSETFRDFGKALYYVISSAKSNNNSNDLVNKFILKQNNNIIPKFSIPDGVAITTIYDLIPLTEVEIQWLQNILNHNLAKAFLSSKEIDCIKSCLPKMNWFDIYDSTVVELYEQHSDDTLEQYYDNITEHEYDDSCNSYDNPNFGIVIRKVMQAICDKRVVRIQYKSQYDAVSSYEFVPYCIEYSKRDNRFRIKAVVRNIKSKKMIKVRTFNADGISKITLTNEIISENVIKEKVNIYNSRDGEKKTLIVFFSDINADQILTEFSCYEKSCIRWGNGRFRMELTYYNEDYAEIVIRLLGYGSLITVWSDDNDNVVTQLKERYQEQVTLYNERTKSKNNLSLEKTEES